MRLASLDNGKADGKLVVVSRDMRRAVDVSDIAPSMIVALENWAAVEGELQGRSSAIDAGSQTETFAFDPKLAIAPLPRVPQWLDGSAFPSHGERMVKAFGLSDITLKIDVPLMYQGCPDFAGANDSILVRSEDDGIDFEGELAVIVSEVKMGASPAEGNSAIRLFVLVNDVSLRALQPFEMSLGFGMIHSKPASVCSPVCITPDELGVGWQDGKLNVWMTTHVNGRRLGHLSGAEMRFSFGDLISHAAKTRRLGAGTMIGSGTFSNADAARGMACLAEKRALEKIETGSIQTPWLQFGDQIRVEVTDEDGKSLFGAIDHTFARSKAEAKQEQLS